MLLELDKTEELLVKNLFTRTAFDWLSSVAHSSSPVELLLGILFCWIAPPSLNKKDIPFQYFQYFSTSTDTPALSEGGNHLSRKNGEKYRRPEDRTSYPRQLWYIDCPPKQLRFVSVSYNGPVKMLKNDCFSMPVVLVGACVHLTSFIEDTPHAIPVSSYKEEVLEGGNKESRRLLFLSYKRQNSFDEISLRKAFGSVHCGRRFFLGLDHVCWNNRGKIGSWVPQCWRMHARRRKEGSPSRHLVLGNERCGSCRRWQRKPWRRRRRHWRWRNDKYEEEVEV